MDFISIPLAFLAGLLSLLSPCVLPMLPVIVSTSTQSSKNGLLMLAAGLALSFAFAGTLLTYLVLTLGLSTEVFRYLSIILLTFIGLTLLSDKLNQKLSLYLSMLTSLLPSYNPIKKLRLLNS
jgi:cytochrome c-type biogenesis protein